MKKSNLSNQTKTAIEAFKLASKHFPDAKTELTNWISDFQLLVCIILSAQTTDKQVNKVTRELFNKYPTAKDLAKASQSDVEGLIKSINYYKTKTKNIIKASSAVADKFYGEVPHTITKLVELPGVGYKTANVFISVFHGKGEGIAVDTHVMRVFQRLALTKETDATKIAHDLEKLYPRKYWHKINSTFVLFGRYICIARKPKCDECYLREMCEYYNNENLNKSKNKQSKVRNS